MIYYQFLLLYYYQDLVKYLLTKSCVMYGILKMFPLGNFSEIKCSSFCKFGDSIFSLFIYFSATLVKYWLKVFAISASSVNILFLYVKVLMLDLLLSLLNTLHNLFRSFL